MRWHGGATLLGPALQPLTLLVYLVWAGAQEFAVQNVAVANLAALGVPRPVLPPLVGAVFAVAHAPVVPLATIALVGGTLWTGCG